MRPIFTVMSDTRPTLVLAGAAGFIGQALATALHARFRVVGLSRKARPADAHIDEYRRCDLFNLREADGGLAGADYAVYLVHSMMPSARLTQGSFADLDLICADNFARAAKAAGVRQIVYLGGLIPTGEPLSEHLRSRLEVERTLGRYGTPVTALRAGIILGAHGSSFQILLRLVRRLPVMVLPKWTQTRTQPVALADVIALLAFAVGNRACFGRSFDLGTPETVSYAELMKRLAAQLGRSLQALPVPFLSPKLSRLWISLVTGAPRELVEPLIESLRHEMVARDHDLAMDLDDIATTAGHAELVYDFRDGGDADGWLHGLFRYEDRVSGHAAETSFGAHIFNTAMTYRDEPQSYSGPPPGLSTRLFLKLGDAGRRSFAVLIYAASAPWQPHSSTVLQLLDSAGKVMCEEPLQIACCGSAMVFPHEVFGAESLVAAGQGGYVLVRDTTCRLFGYHGLMDDHGGFSLDHMFGF